MNAATHITGGFVLAGTLCSFTDVNVFEKPEYIAACVFFSLLPDIDTTKSLLGKIFYPFAWVINRKLGHRTITHSLIFLLFVAMVMLSLYWYGVFPNSDIVKISVFALISHFVFDMITISGIPLLFPWFKNPCVIPGNVNFRFKGGDFKSEFLVCVVCGILCITMQPLFAQGFWTSYNRQFGTIRHVDRENQNTEFYVVCDFDYILNSQRFIGEAIVIESKQNELILFDRSRVFTLNSDNPLLKVNHAKPRISDIPKRFEELLFYNIEFDSLSYLLRGRLASGLIQSNLNVRYIEDAVTYHTNFIKFSNRYDFQIIADIDTSKTSVRSSIARLENSLNQVAARHRQELSRYNQHFARIAEIENILSSTQLSNYERNKLQQELITLKRRNIEQPLYLPNEAQISELEILRITLENKALSFSGNLKILTFGVDFAASNLEEPAHLYAPDYLLASARDSLNF
jgi:inner membrane protein